MANLKIDIATEFTGKKAFKQADTATQKLAKSAKNLGRNLGLAFGTAAILGYAKSSIRAAAEAQGQQERLAKLMRVTVGASNAQIESLNAQATALEKIGVVSRGNITQTQSQLATFNLQADTIARLTPAILDYVTAEKGAAASTDQFKQMTNGLAQALNGNFASLTKTGFVIDDNTRSIIKNGTEAQRTEAIVKVLDSTYKGFNESLRDTPIGQLQLLSNAAQDAKETIGTGLMQALGDASGKGGLAESLSNIASIASTVSDLLIGIGRTIAAIKPFFTRDTSPLAAFRQYQEITRKFREGDAASAMTKMRTLLQSGQPSTSTPQATKIATAQLKATKALTKEQKKQNALKKIAKVFDLEQIQIIAALKGKVSEEDKIRLQAQLAYLNDNEGVASQLTKQILMSQDATGNLYKLWQTLPDAKNPFAYLDEWLLNFQRQLALTKFPTPSAPVTVTTSAGVTTTAVAPIAGAVQDFTPSYTPPRNALAAGDSGFTGPVGIELKITGDGDLTNTIAKNLMQQSLSSGNQTYINRRTGGFE